MKLFLWIIPVVALTIIASHVQAASCTLTAGIPYRSSAASTVYVLADGCQKRPIFNPDVYFSHFSSWDSVMFVE